MKNIRKSILSNEVVFVLFLFSVSVIVRGILSDYTKTMVVILDEMNYVDIARSLFSSQTIMVQEIPSDFQKILYSLVIMPAFIFESTEQQIRAIAWINSIWMSTTIFPVYGLAKRIIKNRVWVNIVLVFSITIPNFLFTASFMSEVVFLPISLCVIYCVWRELEADTIKKKILFGVLTGLLCYLNYLNKEIGLYYLLAYFMTKVLFAIIQKKNLKKNIIVIFCSLMAFGIAHVGMKNTVFAGMINGYVQGGLKNAVAATFQLENIFYLCYTVLYNILVAVFAFGVFPVVITVSSVRKQSDKLTQFIVFISLALIIGCAVTGYVVNFNENFGDRSPRQHLRYIEPLVIPFVICMIYKLKNTIEISQTFWKKVCVYLAAFSFLFIGIVYKVTQASHVDNTSLLYYEKLQNVFAVLDCFTKEWRFLILREMIVVLIVLAAVLLIKRKTIFLKSFMGVFIFLNLINSYIGQKEWKMNYHTSEEAVSLISSIDAELDTLDLEGNILALGVSDPMYRLFSLYLDNEVYVVDENSIVDNGYLNDGIIDLDTEILQARYSGQVFEDLKAIDYILASDAVDYSENEAELLYNLPGGFKIYKNLQKDKLYYDTLFPSQIGNTTTVDADSMFFYSGVDDGGYTSTGGGQYVIYGPYLPILPGTYRISFTYEGLSSNSSESIGRIEIGGIGIDNILSQEVYGDSTEIVIGNLEVSESISKGEIRLLAYQSGLEFKSVTIERIG